MEPFSNPCHFINTLFSFYKKPSNSLSPQNLQRKFQIMKLFLRKYVNLSPGFLINRILINIKECMSSQLKLRKSWNFCQIFPDTLHHKLPQKKQRCRISNRQNVKVSLIVRVIFMASFLYYFHGQHTTHKCVFHKFPAFGGS